MYELEKKRKERRRRKWGGICNVFLYRIPQGVAEEIHSITKILWKAHNLRSLWTKFYYHQFPNLVEILHGDPLRKIREGIDSKGFLNHEYNFNSTTKVKVICAYGGEYIVCCVVYKVKFKLHILLYVVNTLNILKNNGTKLRRCGSKGTVW